MSAADKAGRETQRLTQFQLQGDAAERYERWAVPFVVGPWVPKLLDLAEVRAGERVLDIACGTGVVARLAARRVERGGTVTGLDLNEGMLAVARRLPLPPGLTIDWRQGSGLALPSPTARSTSCSASRDCSSSRIG
jgi:ubiquinone/menaquinone biosynthesis C-methylase UbiE